MEKNNNKCSANVIFINDKGVEKKVTLCGFTAAMEYVNDVVLRNNWTLIKITRGVEYGNH